MHALTQILREAVVLRDIQELSYQEIARGLGLPEGTVKSRINRGRLELARHIRRLEQRQPAAGRGAATTLARSRGRHTGVSK